MRVCSEQILNEIYIYMTEKHIQYRTFSILEIHKIQGRQRICLAKYRLENRRLKN